MISVPATTTPTTGAFSLHRTTDSLYPLNQQKTRRIHQMIRLTLKDPRAMIATRTRTWLQSPLRVRYLYLPKLLLPKVRHRRVGYLLLVNASLANKKRKAESESAVVPKKVKLANGSANAVTSDTETRNIFVGQLSWNVDNDWLAQEFAECGEIESANVQVDRNTGRSRGFGFVHFKTTDAVEKALALNGKEIDGRAIFVDKGNPPDKKASTEKRAQYFGDTSSPPSAVLFVGNLSFGVNEDTLWETFGEHGDVKSVRVPTDRDTGRPKGFAYVEFSEVGSATKAHGALQGFELDGRSIRLDFSQPRDSAGGRGGGQVRPSTMYPCIYLLKNVAGKSGRSRTRRVWR